MAKKSKKGIKWGKQVTFTKEVERGEWGGSHLKKYKAVLGGGGGRSHLFLSDKK